MYAMPAVFRPYTSRISVYSAGTQSIPTGTNTKIELDTETYDNDSEYDKDTNHRFTAKKAGYYHVCANAWLSAVGNEKQSAIKIYKNGAAIARGQDDYTYNYIPGVVAKDVYLNGTTDYIEIFVFHNAGANKDCLGGADVTWATIHRFA